ncbi:acyl-CoA carboxylase epsilon subunit [Streptomyces sp. NPDC090022]|uniref:acyl-CoA carboxylase epsilon subunit n=1 Tax=Streptomyces sp. NPDC090022 TaxID=3365920 RepID=UPI0038027A3B
MSGDGTWRVVRGRPDALETAALAVVLALAVAGSAAPVRQWLRTGPTGWDRSTAFRQAGTWRRR